MAISCSLVVPYYVRLLLCDAWQGISDQPWYSPDTGLNSDKLVTLPCTTQLIVGYQMDRVRFVLCLMVVALVQGQEDELDREGKKLVLKKVRRLRPEEELGQCPEV